MATACKYDQIEIGDKIWNSKRHENVDAPSFRKTSRRPTRQSSWQRLCGGSWHLRGVSGAELCSREADSCGEVSRKFPITRTVVEAVNTGNRVDFVDRAEYSNINETVENDIEPCLMLFHLIKD